MKKLFLNMLAVVITICSMVGIASMSPAAYAVVCPDGTTNKTSYDQCFESSTGTSVEEGLRKRNLMDTMNIIINVIIGVIGFVAVVMMIFGGISFVISQGDSAKVTKARNTILYGVVGLIVALLAFAIVNFVLTNVFTTTPTP